MRALPTHFQQVYSVWLRNFLLFKRSWTVSLFWVLFEPMVILGSIGYGVGSYINNVAGVSYVDFYFPALLCSTSMLVAFFESTYGNFSKLTYQKTYLTMILSPLEPKQIVFGEILWAASKGTLSAVGIAMVGLPLGLVENFYILPALLVIFISSFLFAALGMLVTSLVKNYDSIIYPTSGLIVPMSLLCGTYFPIEKLPLALKYVVYLLPLTHSVSATRSLLLRGFEWVQLGDLAALLLISLFFYRISARRIEAKLIH